MSFHSAAKNYQCYLAITLHWRLGSSMNRLEGVKAAAKNFTEWNKLMLSGDTYGAYPGNSVIQVDPRFIWIIASLKEADPARTADIEMKRFSLKKLNGSLILTRFYTAS